MSVGKKGVQKIQTKTSNSVVLPKIPSWEDFGSPITSPTSPSTSNSLVSPPKPSWFRVWFIRVVGWLEDHSNRFWVQVCWSVAPFGSMNLKHFQPGKTNSKLSNYHTHQVQTWWGERQSEEGSRSSRTQIQSSLWLSFHEPAINKMGNTSWPQKHYPLMMSEALASLKLAAKAKSQHIRWKISLANISP